MEKTSIVVIDSEELVRSTVTRILESSGYKVKATGDFAQALDIIAAEKPTLILTNVYLQGISGHEAMYVIKSRFPDQRVLMMSGLPDEESISQWSEQNRFDIFPKPFGRQELLDKVEQMIYSSCDEQR